MILPNLASEATVTQHTVLGNVSSNSAVQDLAAYKGNVSFLLTAGVSAVGTGNVPNAYVLDSADNSSFAAVSGGAFTAVANTANPANAGAQVLSFDRRALRRYVYVATTIAGTTPNIPLSVVSIAQKERV